MKSIKVWVIFVSVILAVPAVAQQRGWRGIVPLHSTRKDVESLIGPPTQPNGRVYDLNEARVNVDYSVLPCTTGWPYGWNVPPGTVTSIEVFIKGDVRLTDLHLDLSKFTKFINPNARSDIHYTDNEEGFSIRTADLDDRRGERVIAYEFFPAATDQHLMCPEAAAREQQIASGQNAYFPPILSYSDISPEEESSRLEFMLEQLNDYPPGSHIYIIGYAGRESCPNEALLRAHRAKNGLLRLGIGAQRIEVINGGYKNIIWNELYVVKPGGPKPLSSPDIYPKDVRVGTRCP